MASAPVYDAHFSDDRADMFYHSSSFTANALGCAAANANLAIWREEPVRERIAQLSDRIGEGVAKLAQRGVVTGARHLGTIGAVDVTARDAGYLSDLAPRLRQAFLERDMLIRPLGNTIYLMPPYAIMPDDLDAAFAAIGDALDEVKM